MSLHKVERKLDALVRRYRFAAKQDARGSLWPIEFADLPLTPVRVYFVHAADGGAERGGHGHTLGKQLLICLSGAVQVDTALSDERQSIELSEPGDAVLIEAPVWSRQIYKGSDAKLLVLADTPYDPNTYIRDVAR